MGSPPITADDDEVVPPSEAAALHRQLTPLYREQPERLGYEQISMVTWHERFTRDDWSWPRSR